MSIGRFFSYALVLVLAAPAWAHPVAQGALDVVIHRDRVEVQAVVSNEEVLVAATQGGRVPAIYAEAARRHGDYVHDHLRIEADGQRLEGRVIKAATTDTGRPVYTLAYALPAGSPARVELRQDALREFLFAPGNPWEATYLVRIAIDAGPAAEGLLLTNAHPVMFECHKEPDTGSPADRLDKTRLARDYVLHGILHILTGYDHLLFITALVLAVATWWDLVKVISAFTLAHSLTLTLSVLDVVRLPGRIVEPMIAASIVVVAVQNVFAPERSRGAGRLAMAFFFGLFHGLGFAGGLLEAMSGMSGLAVGLAIAAFSLGVEIGHQAVVLPVFGVLHRLASRSPPGTRHSVLRYGSISIGAAGSFYLAFALRLGAVVGH